MLVRAHEVDYVTAETRFHQSVAIAKAPLADADDLQAEVQRRFDFADRQQFECAAKALEQVRVLADWRVRTGDARRDAFSGIVRGLKRQACERAGQGQP